MNTQNVGRLIPEKAGPYIAPCLMLAMLLVLWVFSSGMVPIVRFPEEEINIHVYPDRVFVDGLYVYRNPYPFPVVQGFAIPMPGGEDGASEAQLESINALNGKTGLLYSCIFGKHRFQLRFKPHETVRVRVAYSQYVPACKTHYILKTTQPWGRPLEKGVYRLWPHDGVQITQSNYKTSDADPQYLEFIETNFMPAKDWHFSWEDSR